MIPVTVQSPEMGWADAGRGYFPRCTGGRNPSKIPVTVQSPEMGWADADRGELPEMHRLEKPQQDPSDCTVTGCELELSRNG